MLVVVVVGDGGGSSFFFQVSCSSYRPHHMTFRGGYGDENVTVEVEEEEESGSGSSYHTVEVDALSSFSLWFLLSRRRVEKGKEGKDGKDGRRVPIECDDEEED